MLLNRNAGAQKPPKISVFRQPLQLDTATVEDEELLEEELDGEEYLEDDEDTDEDTDEDAEYTDDEWGQVIEELLIEATLEGRIPESALGLSQGELAQAALELGLMVDTADCGLVLSRDIPLMQQVQELSLSSNAYAKGFSRAFMSGNQIAGESVRKTLKRGFAKGVGRAKTAMRKGAKQLADASGHPVRTNIGGVAALGAGAYATGRMQGSRAQAKRSNALLDNADKRSGK